MRLGFVYKSENAGYLYFERTPGVHDLLLLHLGRVHGAGWASSAFSAQLKIHATKRHDKLINQNKGRVYCSDFEQCKEFEPSCTAQSVIVLVPSPRVYRKFVSANCKVLEGLGKFVNVSVGVRVGLEGIGIVRAP